MSTMLLATFHDLEPAQLLQQRFQQAGIPATITDESRIQRLWFMSEPLAAIHLEVPGDQYLEARQLMQLWDTNDGFLRSAVRCPECQSSRIEFPQLTRKFATPGLIGLLMAARIIRREFYCLECQYTWPVSVTLARRLDKFGWPYDSRLWHPENVRRARPDRKSARDERSIMVSGRGRTVIIAVAAGIFGHHRPSVPELG
jgi:hypothetical protein